MGEVEYFEFVMSFRGKEFYNYDTGKVYDKWEVYGYYKKGNITWMQLQTNRYWIRHRDKPFWKSKLKDDQLLT